MPKFKWLAALVVLAVILAGPLAAQQGGIEGTYRFLKEQPSGTTPSKGSKILLTLLDEGQVDIALSRPGEIVTDSGTYKLNGERISLELPAIGISIKAGPWSLRDEVLSLPIQLFSDKPGTSQWQRIKPEGGAVQVFFARVNDDLERGVPPPEAVKDAADAAKAKDGRITGCEVDPKGEACVIVYEDGHRECLLVATKTSTNRRPTPRPMAPMAADPRTHLICQPHTDPDDPPNKKAIVWAPFNSAPYWSYKESLWNRALGKGRQPVGKIQSFREAGEDLPLIEGKLRSAHYEVTVLKDEAATAKALFEAIMAAGKNPGVLYIASHGTATDGGLIATGAYLGDIEKEGDIHKFLTDAECQRIVRESLPSGYESAADFMGVNALRNQTFLTMWFQATRNIPVAFVAINASFFRRMRDHDGLDLKDSFFYNDSCSSADAERLMEAIGARAYLGRTGPVETRAAAAEAKYLFSSIWRLTVCVTEAVGRMRHAIEAQISVYPEDQVLADVPLGQHEKLRLFGPLRQGPITDVKDVFNPLEKVEIPDATVL